MYDFLKLLISRGEVQCNECPWHPLDRRAVATLITLARLYQLRDWFASQVQMLTECENQEGHTLSMLRLTQMEKQWL